MTITTDTRWARASEVLWDCWHAGRRLTELPEDIRPRTREEGYAIQAEFEARSAHPLFGWKIAATSPAGQAHINVDGPLAGRLLQEKVVDLSRGPGTSADGAVDASRAPGIADVPFGANHMRVAEAEFAFRIGRDLPPRWDPYGVDEVLGAVASLHPAIEVPDSRFDDFTVVGAPQLIADNACAHLFVLGQAAPDDWRDVDLVEHAVLGTVVGRIASEGKGANVLGDPRVALTWLVNELSGLGIILRAGQVVTTGTCLVPLPISPGARVVMDFGRFGIVRAAIR
jgi:2-keto-4-pentenoate hydratase